MIIEVTGDILLSQAQVIAHGVAPNDDFGQGLALSLREQWPSLYKDFRHFCQTQHPKEGTIWSWMSSEGKIVVNLLTQESAYNHGQKAGKANTPNVNHALRELHKFLLSENVSSVALPRLATGVGGLSWEEVYPLIQQHLGELNIPIYIYTTYHKGQAAPESN
jgi:O-acetyl-ADP-ribose deacetylase (regulator of RNase III)